MQRATITAKQDNSGLETLQVHEHLINGLPPTRIPVGNVYRVLPERQLLLVGDMTVEGTLDLDGDMVLI